MVGRSRLNNSALCDQIDQWRLSFLQTSTEFSGLNAGNKRTKIDK